MGRNLTAADIAELTQGQRLNFLVATTIFGIEPWPEQTGTLAYTCKPERPARSRNVRGVLPATPPHYSDDWQSGARVIQWLSQSFYLRMIWHGNKWDVDSSGAMGSCSRPDLLSAVCVVALTVALNGGMSVFDPCL